MSLSQFITPNPVAPGKFKDENRNNIKSNKNKKIKITKNMSSFISLKDLKRHLSMPPFKASYTLEAAILLPLFITVMMYGIFFMRILEVQSGVQRAINMASKTIAVGIRDEEDEVDNNLLAAVTFSDVLIEKNKVPTSYISGGLAGIDYSESTTAGNYVDVKVKYKIKFPIGLLGKLSYEITQESKNRKWIGFDSKEVNAFDNKYVYITEFGTVYHTNIDCTYLNPSIAPVPANAVEDLRNASGGKYYPCKECKGNKNNGIVYITLYGSVYHSSSNCNSIKRTIRRVPLDAVKDIMPECSKCRGEN